MAQLTRYVLIAVLAAFTFGGISTGPAPAQGARPAGVPKAGEDARIDEMIKRGTIKVGVTPVFPWVFRNKSGKGDPYRGSSWMLANAYAKALGVKVEVVDVTNETKVPIVISGGVDVTIASLATTPARKEVVDFIPYSRTAFCLFGLKTNPRTQGIKSIDQLNDPKYTFAAYVGTNQQAWIPKQFPNAQMHAVTGNGQAPVEEVLSGRADFVVSDAAEQPIFMHAYPSMMSMPSDCLQSTLNVIDVGHAIAKNQPVLLKFFTGIEQKMDAQLRKEDYNSIKFAEQHPDQI